MKNPPANAGAAGDSGSIPCWEDTLEEEIQNTLVLLPGKPHRQSSLVAYSPRLLCTQQRTQLSTHARVVATLNKKAEIEVMYMTEQQQ